MAMDVVDYEIKGSEMQFVEVELDPGEAAIGEAGSMMFMEPASRWTPCSATPRPRRAAACSASCSAPASAWSPASRCSPPSTATPAAASAGSPSRRRIPERSCRWTCASLGGTLICQKDAFLCAARGVSLGIYFQQKLSVGFFGGEGFIMQKLDGDGLAFVHAGGTVLKRELQAGETLFVDTGCIVALTPNVSFEIQYVGKIKTALFGGEGLFFAKVTGPGTVWLQSLPFSRLSSRVFAAAPQRGGSREEGSVLGAGALGGVLGGIFGGDDE